MKLILYVSFLFGWSYAEARQSIEPIPRILFLQDQRQLDRSEFAQHLAHPSSDVRIQGALALANLQDSAAVPLAIPLLNDPAPEVREAAAFALGQIGARSTAVVMLERLTTEPAPGVRARILEAIGRCGTAGDLDRLIRLPSQVIDSTLEGDRALGIARFALRSVISAESIAFCFDQLHKNDPQIRWKSLYALWRSGPHPSIDSLVELRANEIRQVMEDRSPEVRMHLATLLGRVVSQAGRNLLLELHRREKENPEWRVQVQIARALASVSRTHPDSMPALLDLLEARNEHVVNASLASLNTLSAENARPYLVSMGSVAVLKRLATGSHVPDALRGEAVIATAIFVPEEFIYESFISDAATSEFLKSRVIAAVAKLKTEKNWRTIRNLLENSNQRLARAAWESVRESLSRRNAGKPASAGERDLLAHDLLQSARTAFSRGDMALTTAVSDAFRDSLVVDVMIRSGRMRELAALLMDVYERQRSPDDVEAMQSLLTTLIASKDDRCIELLEQALHDSDRSVALVAYNGLKAFKGESAAIAIPPVQPPAYTDYDWPKLQSIAKRQRIRLVTTKGVVLVDLLRESAPFTVLSFIRLMERRFFDGLSFHRVVPNFVIQGGDPRGDGWGGPGYSIRSEFGLINYARGMVGVASAGKDTEGCQFFITHSDQPHLDGRYTIFGEVVSGMEVVDRIQVGDRIVKMEISR